MWTYAAALPSQLKIKGGQTKRLLRAAARRWVPRTIAPRPKCGFDPPRAAWLRGPLRPLMDAAIHDRDGLPEIFAMAPLRRRWQRFLVGGRDQSPLFWTVLCLALWHRGIGASCALPSAATSGAGPPPRNDRRSDVAAAGGNSVCEIDSVSGSRRTGVGR